MILFSVLVPGTGYSNMRKRETKSVYDIETSYDTPNLLVSL